MKVKLHTSRIAYHVELCQQSGELLLHELLLSHHLRDLREPGAGHTALQEGGRKGDQGHYSRG
jgi:hypothetical protein